MGNEYLIPVVRLFIINKVREYRLELYIGATELGRIISPSGSIKYVSTIESNGNESGYTDAALNKIAIEFTRKAKEIQAELDQDSGNTLQIKTEYTIHDFFPPEPVEDKRVEKKVFPLPPGIGPAGTLNFLLQTDSWFNEYRTIRQISEYCNAYRKAEWPTGNFSGLCYRLWKKDKFRRLEEGNNDILYKNRVPVRNGLL